MVVRGPESGSNTCRHLPPALGASGCFPLSVMRFKPDFVTADFLFTSLATLCQSFLGSSYFAKSLRVRFSQGDILGPSLVSFDTCLWALRTIFMGGSQARG